MNFLCPRDMVCFNYAVANVLQQSENHHHHHHHHNLKLRNPDNVGDTETKLQAGHSWIRFLVGAVEFSLCPKRPHRLWIPYSRYYTVAKLWLSPEQSRLCVKRISL